MDWGASIREWPTTMAEKIAGIQHGQGANAPASRGPGPVALVFHVWEPYAALRYLKKP